MSSGVPSWSWAKIEGAVRMRFRYDDLIGMKGTKSTNDRLNWTQSLLCEILDCRTTPLSTPNPFGEVTSGALTLRDRLTHAKCYDLMTDTYHIDRNPIKRPLQASKRASLTQTSHLFPRTRRSPRPDTCRCTIMRVPSSVLH